MARTVIVSTLVAAVVCASPATVETYRGVTVAPEHRCTLYHPDDYPHPQSHSSSAWEITPHLLTEGPY